MDKRPITIRGHCGWGNRKTGYEAYGPDGRWGGTGREGDLLGDAMERVGIHEGADFIVVAVNRFGNTTVLDAVEAFISDLEKAGEAIHDIKQVEDRSHS